MSGITFEELVGALGARPSGSGWYNCRCPAHSDRRASFGFRIGDQTIIFNCFAGCQRSEIVAALAEQSLWPVTLDGVPTDENIGSPESRRIESLERILRIDRELVPIAGTWGAGYLRGRGITLASPDIMYHRKLWHPWTGTSWRAMVACVRDVTGRPVALHSTYLNETLPFPPLNAVKAPVEPVRVVTGPLKGNAVHLSPAGPTLLLGEGIETVLSAMQVMQMPGWAALISRNLPHVVLPVMVREVILLADNDVAGERATAAAAARFVREGRQVHIARPSIGSDFNDVPYAPGDSQMTGQQVIHDILNAQPAPNGKDVDTSDDIAVHIAEMNQHWAVVKVGSSVRVMTEEVDTELGTKRIKQVFLKPSDFRTLLLNKVVMTPSGAGSRKQPKAERLADIWLEHPDRRTYTTLGMYPPPLAVPKDCYNLWRGWGVRPKAGAWHLLFDHFENVLAGGDDEALDYLIKWCAWGLQHPSLKLEASLLLIGGQGCGKGTLGNILLRCYGTHGYYLSKKDQLTGTFTGHLANMLFCHVDEAYFGGDRASGGALKALMTQTRMPIQPKFVDIYEVPNRLRLLFTANPGHVLPMNSDDRRCATFESAWPWQDEAERKDYFKRLYDELDHGGVEAFLHDMLTLDLTGFDPRDIPATLIRAQQKTLSLKGTAAWWFDMLQVGDDPWSPLSNEMGLAYGDEPSSRGPGYPCRVSKDWLYKRYEEWAKLGAMSSSLIARVPSGALCVSWSQNWTITDRITTGSALDWSCCHDCRSAAVGSSERCAAWAKSNGRSLNERTPSYVARTRNLVVELLNSSDCLGPSCVYEQCISCVYEQRESRGTKKSGPTPPN